MINTLATRRQSSKPNVAVDVKNGCILRLFLGHTTVAKNKNLA